MKLTACKFWLQHELQIGSAFCIRSYPKNGADHCAQMVECVIRGQVFVDCLQTSACMRCKLALQDSGHILSRAQAHVPEAQQKGSMASSPMRRR